MPAPIFAAVGRGIASAAQGAVRAGTGLVRGAMSAARGAAGFVSQTASKASGSLAQGAAKASSYVAGTGSRATAAANAARPVGQAAQAAGQTVRQAGQQAAQAAGQAGSQAAQQAAANIQQSAQSGQSSIQRMANQAAQSIQRLAQQLFNLQAPGGGGGGNGPPAGNNAPPAGNSPGGRQPKNQVQSYLGNQARLFARQAASSAVGNSVAQGMQVVRLFMRYGGPMGGINAAKDAAGAGGRAVSWLARLPGRLKDFGDSLVKAREHLVEYNGSLAAAAAKLEVDRIGRNIRLGAATAKTGSAQTAAQSRLENAMLPMQALMANLTNAITGAIQNGVAQIIELAPVALAALPAFGAAGVVLAKMKAAIDKYMTEEAGKALPLQQFANDLQNGKFMKRRGPPIGKAP